MGAAASGPASALGELRLPRASSAPRRGRSALLDRKQSAHLSSLHIAEKPSSKQHGRLDFFRSALAQAAASRECGSYRCIHCLDVLRVGSFWQSAMIWNVSSGADPVVSNFGYVFRILNRFTWNSKDSTLTPGLEFAFARLFVVVPLVGFAGYQFSAQACTPIRVSVFFAESIYLTIH